LYDSGRVVGEFYINAARSFRLWQVCG